MSTQYGDSTRCVKAVGAQAVAGQPVAPAPVPESTYHLSADESEQLDTYGRGTNPTWRQLESAIAQLEGATEALVFGSGIERDHGRAAGARPAARSAGCTRRRVLPGPAVRI